MCNIHYFYGNPSFYQPPSCYIVAPTAYNTQRTPTMPPSSISQTLKDIPPIWVACLFVFMIYLLETHPFLAGFAICGLLITVIFKKYGVLILSLIADLADYGGAAVPIVGDPIDIFIVIIQAIRYGPRGFVGLVELIPLVDLLPIMTINAAWAEYQRPKG